MKDTRDIILYYLLLAIIAYSLGYVLGTSAAKAADLYVKGDKVTCMYEGVFSFFDGEEFVNTVPIKCIVLEASGVLEHIAPNYQHIKVDCTKDVDANSSSIPGVGMVKGHKLNYKIRWYNSTSCSHFQRSN